MSIENDMLSLIDQIRRPIIFYLPMQLFQKIDQQRIDAIKKLRLINTLMVVDTKDQPHFIEQDIKQVELLRKEKILKSNVLKLIEMKGKYDLESFVYLFSEYSKEVDVWVVATDFIQENAKTDTENYIATIQQWLELQHVVLKQHQQELKNRFGDWSSPLELNRILKIANPESIKTDLINDQTKPTINQSKPKRTRKKKDVRPSKEKVDDYLLKVHFNVDFSKINSD